jgi:hypothetical protein
MTAIQLLEQFKKSGKHIAVSRTNSARCRAW